MIVTRTWLNDFVDISNISSKEISDKLNLLGLEVESITKINVPDGVVLGKIIDCKKHPNADKLNVCMVDIGADKLQQIVCGSNSVKNGKLVAVATIGTKLKDIQIEPIQLRGIDSFGMICSYSEINVPKLKDDIIILDNSIGDYKLGTKLSDIPIFSDEIIDIDITANRGDCFSIYGIARELSAGFSIALKPIEEYSNNNIIAIGRVLNTSCSLIDSLLRYSVVDFKNFSVNFKINMLLKYAQKEPLNQIDAIICYASYTTGVILNAYSFDDLYIQSGVAHMVAKKDKNNLDTVYSDKKIVSVVGIDHKITPTKDSGLYVIEASYIDPDRVSKFVTEHKLKTKDIYFNTSRGSNPYLHIGLNFILKAISSISNSTIYTGYDILGNIKKEKTINIILSKISKIIGQDIDKSKIIEILKKLDFDVRSTLEDDNLRIAIPLYRHDISTIQDLAEEIVRSIGIDNIKSKPLDIKDIYPKQHIKDIHNFKKHIRYKAIANGFYESVSFIFYKKELLKKYGFKIVKEQKDIINPITSDLDTLRTTIILNLLDSASMNMKNGYKQVSFFEIGDVFDENRDMIKKISFIFSGQSQLESFTNSGKPKPMTIFEFSRKISNTIGAFELQNIKDTPNNLVHPFVSGWIIQNGIKIGYLAKVLDSVASLYKLPQTFICEIDFDKIKKIDKQAKEISKFQTSIRDITLLVDENIQYKDIKSSILEVKNRDIKEFYLLDVYKDENIKDKLSITVRVVFQSPNKTLLDSDIDNILNKILDKLKINLGIYIK